MKTKKVFTIALSMAFLLLCSMPALAETVEGQGYAAGSVGSVQYDPYTGQSDVQWATSYGINPYGNPATTTTTATETATGVRIDSSNATPNGYSYSAGQATDSTRYSDVTRTVVTQEEQYASAEVEVAGSSAFFLEAVADSAAANVGIAQAVGDISVNLNAANSEGDGASAFMTATSVNGYAGGALAVNFDTTSVFQGAAAATDVEAGASAANDAGFSASVEVTAASLVGFSQQAVATVDTVAAQQTAAIANFATLTNTASANGFDAATTTAGHQIINYNGGAGATAGSFDLNPVHDVSGNWTAVGAYQNYAAGNFVTSTNTATSVLGNTATNSVTAVGLTGYQGAAITGAVNLHADLGGPLAPIDVNIDGAGVAQTFGTAFLFRTSNTSQSSLGATAFAQSQGIAQAGYLGAAGATTGNVSVAGTDLPFDLAAAAMVGGPFIGGPFSYQRWGAADASGNDTAAVSALPAGGFQFNGFSAGAAAGGNIGAVDGAGAGALFGGPYSFNSTFNGSSAQGTGFIGPFVGFWAIGY